MEYIRKSDIVKVLTAFKDAREGKKNCSKQTAMEYAIYDYVLKIVDTLEVKVEDD